MILFYIIDNKEFILFFFHRGIAKAHNGVSKLNGVFFFKFKDIE